LTATELKQLLQTVGERDGWDFSRVRDQRDPVPWDYLTVVRQYLRPTDQVLDVGTGGGENFLALAPHYRFLDVPSFIFWCNAVPWLEPFDPDKHWLVISQILAQYTTARGIETNEYRELLIIQK
jgi:hypothetical protein